MGEQKSIDEILNEFRHRVKFSDFIGKFVKLVPRGNSFVGKCPFHNEKTPSFNVNDDKALFYCFGCKAGGNVVNFLTKFKNFSFKESMEYLANFLGLSISKSKSKDDKKVLKYIKMLKLSNDFFIASLKKNKFAYDYIFNRIPDAESISKFQIGYCPDDQHFIDFLNHKGLKKDDLIELGFFIKKNENEMFGRFKDRITFPIFNYNHEIVGFGARSIRKSKIKYINSSESPVFKKSENLYGLEQNYNFIKKNREIFLVEGYLDVISLFRKNVRTAVATLGTSLSERQIQKMWMFTDIPYVCFDGDEAGTESTKKVSLKILECLLPGKSFKFIFLPDNLDPDSFIKRNNAKDFFSLAKKSLDLSEVIWQDLAKSLKNFTPESFAYLDQKIRILTKRISNQNIAIEYQKFLIDKKNKLAWSKRSIGSKNRINVSEPSTKKNLNEMMLIGFMLFEEDYLEEFQEEISSLKLRDSNLEKFRQKILENFSRHDYKENISNLENVRKKKKIFFEELSNIRKTHLKNLQQEEKNIFFKHMLKNLMLPSVLDERDILKNEIISCKDEIKLTQLIKKYDEINNEIKKIKNKELD